MEEANTNPNIVLRVVRRIRAFFGYDTKRLSYLYAKRNSKKIIDRYFKDNLNRKLQIGCQGKILEGWLNVDLDPKSNDVVFMDATKPFPFSNETFDYIFSEHMIEHITLEEGLYMLSECYRVLKPGGKIRIVTPDLSALVRVFHEPKEPLHQTYIEFYIKRFLDFPVPDDPTHVFNIMFYQFGHRYIYSGSVLQWSLEQVGFLNAQRFQVGQSDELSLSKLEKHAADLGEENNKIESMVMQGIK